MDETEISLAPLLHPIAVADPLNAFDTALAAAVIGEARAADCFYSTKENRAEMAIVVEPEGPFSQALFIHYAMMVAVGDALGVIAPPELAVQYRWPDKLLINGGLAGQSRLGAPANIALNDEAPWLVTGFSVDLGPEISEENDSEPGDNPGHTWLWQEGCGGLSHGQIISAVASHFLKWTDTLLNEGPVSLRDYWLGRLIERENFMMPDGTSASILTLDETGGLVVKQTDKTSILALSSVVERAGG